VLVPPSQNRGEDRIGSTPAPHAAQGTNDLSTSSVPARTGTGLMRVKGNRRSPAEPEISAVAQYRPPADFLEQAGAARSGHLQAFVECSRR